MLFTQDLCTNAYQELKEHGGLLVALFSMMLMSGLPEVTEVDLSYLRKSLKPTKEGEKPFLEVIEQCRNNNWKVQ